MVGYLLYRDGRRTEMEARCVGVPKFMVPFIDDKDGVMKCRVFEPDAEIVDGCVFYRETEVVEWP